MILTIDADPDGYNLDMEMGLGSTNKHFIFAHWSIDSIDCRNNPKYYTLGKKQGFRENKMKNIFSKIYIIQCTC